MNICFFTITHFGDVFFSQPFILNICKNNPNLQFYYWCFLGHFLFENYVNNLKYIENDIVTEYNNNYINGNEPDNLIKCDESLKKMFIINGNTNFFYFEHNNKKYIALNTHCAILNTVDMYPDGLINGYINVINNIKNTFGLNIINYIEDGNLLPIIKNSNYNINKFLLWHNNNNNNNNKYVFFYNFRPRSITYFMNCNPIIKYLSIQFPDLFFIVPVFDNELDNIQNIKFCDKDFDCIYDTRCSNLLMIEKIQLFCKSIFIIPCGASWMFMNNEIENYIDKKIFMIEFEFYSNKLNKWYNYCRKNNDTIVDNININNIEPTIRELYY